LSSFNLFKDYGADLKNRKLKEPTKEKTKKTGRNTFTEIIKAA